MKKTKVIIGVFILVLVMLLSEFLYASRNKWVFYSYLLNIARFFNNVGATDIAFFVSTEGKYKLPENNKFKEDVYLNLKSLPAEYDLPTTIYYFAISAYNDGLDYLTPQLLEISVKMDPDFSNWRVELANYYLVVGNVDQARVVLQDCIKLEAPARHCREFMNNQFVTNQPEGVGFLKDSTIQYCKSQLYR